MKTMTTLEKIEFATLILETVEKAGSLTFEKLTRSGSYISPDRVEISASDFPHVGKVSREGYLPALRFIVDNIRRERGEPSREETANAALAEDISHATSPPVVCGPDACCSCGSKRRLKIERKVQVSASWKDGRIVSFFTHKPAQPGEIGTCPDCGKSYRFGA